MSKPTVTTLTEAWYDRLPEVFRVADAAQPDDGLNGYPLLRFGALVGDVAQPIDDLYVRFNYVSVADGGPAAFGGAGNTTCDLVNPATADVAWLPWQAQIYGVVLDPALSEQGQRDTISGASSGWQAGTPGAIAAAAQTALTGTKYVQVYDHAVPNVAGDGLNLGTVWDMTIVTRTTETPDPAVVLDAIVAKHAKPAGVKLRHMAYQASWGRIESVDPNWAAIRASGSWQVISNL